MGYYTNFTLRFDVDEVDNLDELRQEIEKMNIFDMIGLEDGCMSIYAKWYDYEKDMTLLSARFCGILFELYGDGEDAEDIWVQYFKNGMTQYCPGEIVFDDYDEGKLKCRYDDIDARSVNDDVMYSYQYSV